jgi:DNA-binding NarL/FixJ family response regulator
VSNPRSVLVVDDQAPFRLAARAVLRRLDGFEFAGEASSGPQAIELADTLHPSLILMDINMPDMNGIEATRRIVAGHPAAASGAIAYVSKEHLAADTIRELWETRTSGNFVSR